MGAEPSNTRVAWSGGAGPAAIFTHANGFPPGAYRPLLDQLARSLRIEALALRPLVQPAPPDPIPWGELGEDIVAHLAAADAPPVIGVGHSLGATALIYAAALRPERFAGLVLLEPAMLGPALAFVYAMLPLSVRGRIGPARGALAKRDRWPDEAAFRATCKRSGLYEDFSAEAMDAFVHSAIAPVPDGVGLVFSKRWEAHFFLTAPNPAPALRRTSMPLVGIRGRPSVFMTDARWAGLTRARPDGWFTQVPEHGHLMPLEAPARTAAVIFEGLSAVGLLAGAA